ncbi:pyridoxal-phosphate dependent enzyme, partial [Verrucomicrobia bacterium]|nr:pyridoxal-phosphate dependent enzyme [Verrucomicrobiota bacterium]MDC0144361.1 pyridoxal-phosphate dependent enzyme [Verrucomicrobiota bacterium]
IDKVTDEEILTAYKMITEQEGIFVELASAAALAGIIKLQNARKIGEGSIVVATMTGHGLKDPDNAVEHANVEVTTVEATLDAVKAAIGI